MSLRRLVVDVDVDSVNVAEFCRQHGVSTSFFWALRKRAKEEGEGALLPRSRAPKRVANRLDAAAEDEIVAIRKELVDAGLDAGPATIRFHLEQRHPGQVVASEATIWRVLWRRGFIVADPSKAPKTAGRSFAAERANECWQIDDTGWQLADETPVKLINVIDDCTRTLIVTLAVITCTAPAAFEAMVRGARRWGWPARFLSDNARAFRHGLARALAELGIAHGHSRPYHPQTCGKVERFHQTLKQFLAAQDPAHTLADLQAQLDRFAHIYNHQRPHRSIGRRYPAEVWAETAKSGPASRPLNTPTAIYYGTVLETGTVGAGRRYLVNVSTRNAGKATITIVTGLACHVFSEGILLRQLTLDPTRRYQPLNQCP